MVKECRELKDGFGTRFIDEVLVDAEGVVMKDVGMVGC